MTSVDLVAILIMAVGVLAVVVAFQHVHIRDYRHRNRRLSDQLDHRDVALTNAIVALGETHGGDPATNMDEFDAIAEALAGKGDANA